MDPAERLPDSDFYAVYCNSVYYMERSGQPACLHRICVKYTGILDRQSAEYPHRKPDLCFTLLADLRCSCPFIRRNCQRIHYYALDSDFNHPFWMEGVRERQLKTGERSMITKSAVKSALFFCFRICRQFADIGLCAV